MKRLAGSPNPRSWKETKLSTCPGGGDGAASARGSNPLRLRVTGEGTKQAIDNKGLQIVHRDGRERPRVARRNNGHPVGHHQANKVAAERTRCAVFFLWLFPQVAKT
jgi:hypothetical protein